MSAIHQIATRAVAVVDAPPFPAITAGSISGVAIQTVDARSLHAFLDVRRHFADWIKDRVETFGFERGIDFEVLPGSVKNPRGGRPSVEYVLTLDMAKELGMVENNDRGRIVRRYFIDCERKAKAPSKPALRRPPSSQTIRQTFAWGRSLLEDLGLRDNQAVLGANALTTRITGVDVLDTMGVKHLAVPQQEALLNATEVGSRLGGVSARRINTLLSGHGLQTGSPGAYEPTAAGIAAGGIMVDVARTNGTGTARQLRWSSSIADTLRPFLNA